MRNSTTQQTCYTNCSKYNTSSNSSSLSTNNKEKNLKNFNSISNSKELEEEVHDLKAMLEMQEMINHEQEQRLRKNSEEKKNLMSEKNSCLVKISKMQEDIDNKVLRIKGLEEKIVELEMALIDEKKNLDEEFEKVKKLRKDNKNLQQTIEKKTHKINKLKSQLEDERSFYFQEKMRYYEEMKRRKNHSTEVQTDHVTVVVGDDTASLKKSIDDRLRALYKHQLITTCLICEKYIRLQHYKNVLHRQLSKTRKEYKKAVCDIMLEFDQCRAEYTAVLEDRNYNKDPSENMTDNMLKIVNRSNRLASDNAVLKQELLHLNNCLCLIKAYHHSKYDESQLNMNEINCNKINSDVSLNDNNRNNTNNNINYNKVLLKKKKRIRRKNHVKRKIKKNNFNNNYKNCSSAPESTEHDSSDCYENDKTFKNSINYKVGLKKCDNTSSIINTTITTINNNNNNNSKNNNNKSISMLSSNNSVNENLDAGIIPIRNNRVNICPSFMSFSSDNSVYILESFQCSKNEETKKNVLKQNELVEGSDISCKSIFKCNIKEETEPAFLPVTSCDEIKPYKQNNHVVTEITQFSNNFRDNLQEWLAKTPIIECSEWSKSVQGSEIIKTESAPELLMKSSLSSVPLYPK